jgi:hypothetical protein
MMTLICHVDIMKNVNSKNVIVMSKLKKLKTRQ